MKIDYGYYNDCYIDDYGYQERIKKQERIQKIMDEIENKFKEWQDSESVLSAWKYIGITPQQYNNWGENRERFKEEVKSLIECPWCDERDFLCPGIHGFLDIENATDEDLKANGLMRIPASSPTICPTCGK